MLSLVELGSWKGKSSVMSAGGLLAKEAPRLFCVDPFGCDEDPEYQRKYYEPLLRQDPRDDETDFRKNVRSCGVDAIVSPIKGYSFEGCLKRTRPLDFLFIDANHEYRAVLRDTSRIECVTWPSTAVEAAPLRHPIVDDTRRELL